jgi:hypothetical protein
MATRLEKFYEDKFGTPQSRGELYTGFFLIIAGFILSIVGVGIFIAMSKRADLVSYNWRETGGVIAALGPPAIFVGISVTLPTKWTMRLLDALGIILAVVATILFMVFYPYKWNTSTGHEFWAILLYVGALACLLASTISSLIGYYVARATAGMGGGSGAIDAPDYNYDIPDSVIERDIELAMRRYNVSWGGEGADAQSKAGIQFNVNDDFAPGTVIGGKGTARVVTLDAPQVDSATDKLRSIRGTKGTTSIGTQDVDATTAALLKFRQQKQQQEVQKANKGFWQWLRRLFGGKPKTAATVAAGKPGAAKPTPQQQATVGKPMAKPPQQK